MTKFAATLLFLKNIDTTIVIIVGVVAFVIGFLFRMQGTKNSSKSLDRLKRDASANQKRIDGLKERIGTLEKQNDDLRSNNSHENK